MKSLLNNIIQREKIRTTEAKAKELKPQIEKLVSKAKKGDLHSRRLVMEKIGPKYKERKGGYTRIIKLPPRAGDASKMAIIEFV